MTYLRKGTPAETLTAKENASKMGTFTHRSWHKLAVLEARANFYKPGQDMKAVPHPMKRLVDVARETSGAVGGEFRKDVVEAMKSPQTPTVGLAVPNAQPLKKSTTGEASGV